MSRLADGGDGPAIQASTAPRTIPQPPCEVHRESAESDRPLMLFDLSVRGHHPAYIQHLIRHALEQPWSGRLVIVVSPRFFEEHGDVVDLARHSAPKQIQFQGISCAEADWLGPRKTTRQRLQRALREWQLLLKYARALDAGHCLALYFDTCLRPLAISQALPCPISGIYFRPTFHYSTFARYQASRKQQVQGWWEQGLLSLLGRRPQLHTIFSLDPFATPHLNRLLKQAQAISLPDPVDLQAASINRVEELRADLNLEPGRTVALIFGALTGRKGVPQLLEAIAQLSTADAQQLCLLLVGESNIADNLDRQMAAITQRLPVQFVRRYEFVPETDVSAYFQLADLVMAPYQQHVGMSGILLQAAAAGKPVLSSDYGLMGELVHRYQLGLAVDSTQPAAIAQGLHACLTQPLDTLGDRTQMQQFAEANSATKFSQVIFQSLLSTARSS